MRIGVDFDDVLYPYHFYLKKRIRERWGVDLGTERVTTFYYELHPLLRERGVTREMLWTEVQRTWQVAEDHEKAALLDADAAPVLESLQKHHKIVLVTARHDNALPLIEAFLRRHGIRAHQILLGKSEKSGFDILIDDFPKHAEENAAAGGYSILYTIDENSNYDETRRPRIFRARTWKDVDDLVRFIERRRPSIA